MPDLKSELSKLAHAWDNHEDKIRSTKENNVTTTKTPAPARNNVMRACFDLVQKMPGKKASFLTGELAQQGYKATSTTSVFSQLVRSKQIQKWPDGTLHPNPSFKTYQPIYVKKKPKLQAGIAALKGDTAPAAATVTVRTETKGVSSIVIQRNWTPEMVLDKLTLAQAKQMYEALRVYFG